MNKPVTKFSKVFIKKNENTEVYLLISDLTNSSFSKYKQVEIKQSTNIRGRTAAKTQVYLKCEQNYFTLIYKDIK